jgi:DnaJ-class molecular chaperone
MKETEELCDRCGGVGYVYHSGHILSNHWRYYCAKCHGHGKLDWVEKIFGKSRNDPWVYGEAKSGAKIRTVNEDDE